MTERAIVQLKLLILESLQAQNELAKFLKEAARRYGQLLSADEISRGTRLMERVSETIERLTQVVDTGEITISDASYHPYGSDDKLPEHQLGLCCVYGTPDFSVFLTLPLRFETFCLVSLTRLVACVPCSITLSSKGCSFWICR